MMAAEIESLNIVHSNLRPENIFIELEASTVKKVLLMNFDYSYKFEENLIGPISQYMPPEVLRLKE
jgi:serine/threonine protein kinase